MFIHKHDDSHASPQRGSRAYNNSVAIDATCSLMLFSRCRVNNFGLTDGNNSDVASRGSVQIVVLRRKLDDSVARCSSREYKHAGVTDDSVESESESLQAQTSSLQVCLSIAARRHRHALVFVTLASRQRDDA